jgi:hypothetical protein
MNISLLTTVASISVMTALQNKKVRNTLDEKCGRTFREVISQIACLCGIASTLSYPQFLSLGVAGYLIGSLKNEENLNKTKQIAASTFLGFTIGLLLNLRSLV